MVGLRIARARMYACMYVCTYVCVFICVCVCIYIVAVATGCGALSTRHHESTAAAAAQPRQTRRKTCVESLRRSQAFQRGFSLLLVFSGYIYALGPLCVSHPTPLRCTIRFSVNSVIIT